MIRRLFDPRILFLLGLLLPAPAAGGSADAPDAVVERFHETLLAVMKEADSLGVTGRYQRLEPDIGQAFDLALMIRVASGAHWKKATESQRQRLLAAFTRMSVSTYASQFDGFSGQSFETVGVRPGPQQTQLVKTRIVRPEDEPVGLTYVTRESDGGWRIVDILLDDEISELAVRRSEYHRVLKSKGLEGLIAILEEKADVLLAD